MIKSKIKTKVIPFLGISVLLLLSMLCSTADVLGQHASTAAAKFEPTKENPTEYGVIVPSPNMMSTASIYGSNQGYFEILDWNNTQIDDENVNITGKDISLAYPWYFDEYTLDSTTDDGIINPWNDINWVNVSALGVENETINPYYLNTVWNSYSMSGSGSLSIPLNSSIPMEINISIGSPGPKILKLVWRLDNPTNNPYNSHKIISPSGKSIYQNISPLDIKRRYIGDSDGEFEDKSRLKYIPFVAYESGTYRLLLDASYSSSIAYLDLEFINTQISDLSIGNTVEVGNEEIPTIQDQWEDEIENQWIRFKGKKGETILLDTLFEYYDISDLPFVHLWIKGKPDYANAYSFNPITVAPSTTNIYFSEDSEAYISFIDSINAEHFRASVGIREVPIVQHQIGGNVTLAKVSRYQQKAINFSVPQDSFIRLNYTSWGKGKPVINADGTPNRILYKDSNSLKGYTSFAPFKKIGVNNMDYYYYYLPAGDYLTYINNQDIEFEGLIQLTSKYIDYKNGTIPINDLSYPDKFASTFSTETFNPSEAHYSLKNAEWLTLNITEPGQYRLNTTLYAAENPGSPLEKSPDVLYAYNTSDDMFYDFDYPNLTYYLNESDFILIGSYCKYPSMLINISTSANPAHQVDFLAYSPSDDDWKDIVQIGGDGTNDLTDNGTVSFDTGNTDYLDNWQKGRDESINLLQIDNETQEEFYWLMINNTDVYTDAPEITKITLLNSTISGNMSMVILKDSEYQYADYWEIEDSKDPNFDLENLITTRDESTSGFDSRDRYILTGDEGKPYIVGFEEGVYKVLLIPHDWCYPGDIVVNFAVENYWPYGERVNYNILNISAGDPILYAYEIDRFDTLNYGNNEFLTPYTWVRHINFTENQFPFSDEGYLLLKCFGNAYQWTQLVVQSEFIANYSIYLMQDIPWRQNHPDWDEVTTLVPFSENNSVYEFGVFEDEWFLLFEYDNVQENETLTFHLALSQYNTTNVVMGSSTTTSTSPGTATGTGAGNLLIGGIVIGGVAAVVIGVVYVIMRKRGGRVFSKTPG